MEFYDLDISDNVLDALEDMNFSTCTPIQEKCIPCILKGKDIIGIAQTGTGKTAAYLLPILSIIDEEELPRDAVNCIIMSPTRELAQQIDQAMQGFSYYMDNISSVAIYGGNDGNRYDQELRSLKYGANVIIATPGRLISHITMGNVDFSNVSFFVLDEADRMLDMGFYDDIITISKNLPKSCQTILFSATMPDKIEIMAKKLLKAPEIIKLSVSKPAEKIKQQAYICHENQKIGILNNIFKGIEQKRIIIFSSSKAKVKDINKALRQKGINSDEMHSDLDQKQRNEVMFRFKSGEIGILVATDIVARGIDIDDISMVINYDVPRDVGGYIHRMGRTARADKNGTGITLVNSADIHYFMEIERFIGITIDKLPIPNELGPGPEYKPTKKRRSSFNNKRSNNKTQENKISQRKNNTKAKKYRSRHIDH